MEDQERLYEEPQNGVIDDKLDKEVLARSEELCRKEDAKRKHDEKNMEGMGRKAKKKYFEKLVSWGEEESIHKEDAGRLDDCLSEL